LSPSGWSPSSWESVVIGEGVTAITVVSIIGVVAVSVGRRQSYALCLFHGRLFAST
jgi:hypothetical protein